MESEIEATLKKIADTQLVHAKLILDNERDWRRRADASDLRMDALLKAVQSHEDRMDRHDGRMDRIEAAMERLIENMDKFIKGLNRGNGHS